MSLILDALRRKSSGRGGGGDEPERAVRAQAVLATLGYTKPGRNGLSVKGLFVYCVAALGTGFLGLWLVVFLLVPAASPARPGARPPSVARGGNAPTPSAATAAPVGPTTLPAGAPRSASPLLAARLPSTSPPPVTGVPPAPPMGPLTSAQLPVAPPLAQPVAAVSAQSTAPSVRGQPSLPPVQAVAPTALRVPVQPTVSPAQAATAGSEFTRVPTGAPGSRRPQLAPDPPILAPSPPQVPAVDHFGLALYYQRVSDFDKALIHYRALLEQNDASAEVHNNLGLLYQDRGQMDDAMTQFQRAIAIDPRYVRAHNNLGVALMRNNLLDPAGSEFRVALGLDPRNVESLVNLALVQKSAGRMADARMLLRRALAIDPRNAGSHYNLAVVADEGGDVSTAIEHYRAFLRFGTVTHAELAGPVRARLTALGSG